MNKSLVDCKVIAITSDRPRTGKSTCGELLHKYLSQKCCNVEVMAFNDKLFEMTATLVGETLDEFMFGYDDKTVDILDKDDYDCDSLIGDVTEWYKDYPIHQFQGELRSKREMIIWCSENFVKPHVADNYFGEVVAKKISWQDYVIITGIGFVSEAESIINRVGAKNLTIIQLTKDVENSVKCSRKMLTPTDFNEIMCPQFIEVKNDGTLEELNGKLIDIIGKIK